MRKTVSRFQCAAMQRLSIGLGKVGKGRRHRRQAFSRKLRLNRFVAICQHTAVGRRHRHQRRIERRLLLRSRRSLVGAQCLCIELFNRHIKLTGQQVGGHRNRNESTLARQTSVTVIAGAVGHKRYLA